MTMRKIRSFIASLFLFATASLMADQYPPAGWETSFQRALDRAAAEDKHILIDFTGSDWCGWCKRLDREVFSKAEFKEFAEENLVLLFIDSPSGIELSESQVEQNEKLGSAFQVQGYPTVALLRADSTPVLMTGYREGGVTGYIDHLKEAMESENRISAEQREGWINEMESFMGVNIAAAGEESAPAETAEEKPAMEMRKKNS
jgi:thioredoxin-related protein